MHYQILINRVYALSAPELNEMAGLLENGNFYLQVIDGRLQKIDKPTGCWTCSTCCWKPKNQRLNAILNCVKNCLAESSKQYPILKGDEQTTFLLALNRLDCSFQNFSNVRNVRHPAGRFNGTEALLRVRDDYFKHKDLELASKANLISQQEAEVKRRMAAVESFENDQKTLQDQILQTPVVNFKSDEPYADLRKRAREGEGDCFIRCHDTTDELVMLHAHSIILQRTNSPFIRAIFSSEWDQKSQCHDGKPFVICDSYSSTTIDQFLDWMYLGTLTDKSLIDLINLYQLSDELCDDELKDCCKRMLLKAFCRDSSLIYTVSIDYWNRSVRHPVVEDLLINLIPDFCNLYFGVAHHHKRMELVEIFKKCAETDVRYWILVSRLLNPLEVNEDFIARFGIEEACKILDSLGEKFPFSYVISKRIKEQVLDLSRKPCCLFEEFAFAVTLDIRGDFKGALMKYQSGADMGYCPALAAQGFFIYYGLAVEANQEKGLSIIEQAAKKGSINAYNYLGMIYCRRKEFDKGIRAFENGVKLGSHICQMNLAIFYFKGWGVPHNKDQAQQHYLQAKKANPNYLPLEECNEFYRL